MGTSVYLTPFGTAIFLGGGTLLLLVLLKTVGSWLAPLLFTFTLSITVTPLIRWLEQRGLRRGGAVAVVFLGAFVAAALAILFVVGQVEVFVKRIPEYQLRLSEQLAPLEPRLIQLGLDPRAIAESGALSSRALARQALALSGAVLSQVGSMSVFLFLLLVMAVEAPSYSRTLETRFPAHSAMLARYRVFLHEVQAQYRIASLSNLVSATALTATYLAFRIDFALLWGFLTFFMSYIPRFGMLLSFIPPVLMALVQHGIQTALLVLLVGIVINGLMDSIITPRLTGKGLSLRTSVVAIAALIWLWVFGPLGAILSVSLMLFVRMLLASSPVTLPMAYVLSTEDYAPPDETSPPEAPAKATPESR